MENLMHGLTGGGWKRSVGHGHRSEAARRGNPGKSGCGTYRRATSPRQPPTLLRPGVPSAVFGYLSHYAWLRVGRWLCRKHHRSGWKDLRRRYCVDGWWPASEERSLFNPAKVSTTRYRYRGAVIPTPWPTMG